MVEEGKPAPDFELTSDAGERVRLSSLRGRPVVLYFYPKDDTPGCTTQACGIRDVYADFRDRGAVVLGVSPDDEASHSKFKQKYSLPFTLLADPDHVRIVHGSEILACHRRSYDKGTQISLGPACAIATRSKIPSMSRRLSPTSVPPAGVAAPTDLPRRRRPASSSCLHLINMLARLPFPIIS